MGSRLRYIALFVVALLPWLATAQKSAEPQAQSALTTRSPHGPLNIACQNCHTLDGWKPIRAVPEFDHNTTRFPLRGLHQGVTCTSCHTKPVFTNVGHLCAECHADIHRGKLGANCEQCHSVRGWKVQAAQIQQHNGRFPLIGAHAAVSCDECHKNGALSNYTTMSTDCYSCHQKEFQTAQPNHVALNFPTTCTQCHSMDNWLGAKFDHLKMTGFALTGAHATLDCQACHVGGKYTGTPATCVGCHLNDFNKTNNPPHVQAGFPQICQQCHSTAAWNPATFDHNMFTKFPLTGMHVNVACTQCHINNQFVGTPTDCASCHMKDFNGTTNPNHAQGGFPTACQQCHTTATWLNATFDHTTTGFALTGAHASVQCSQCHINGNYTLTSADTNCANCHMKDFQGTNNPNHAQVGIPQTCAQCHTTQNWDTTTFDHSTTGFALTGAHTTTPCTSCHVNNNYQLTSANTACYGCHSKDYQGTTQPNHVQASLPQDCTQCHTTTNWGNASFDHSTTGFPLVGAHTTLQCAQCHINGNYTLMSANTTCISCHQTDFNNTTDPPHAASNFSTSCQSCHNVNSWANATFDHSTTGWALTGGHTTVACSQCHTNGNYKLTSANTACAGCHMTDFNGTTNPNHVQQAFPTTCDQCHTTANWTSATFDHSKTGFPLTGAHTSTPCASCHINNNYNLISANTACYGCHSKDYQGTTQPNHVQANMPQTCQQCHTTTNWGNASFDHSTTGFPLTGAHTTLLCAQCHINGNYNLTSANTTCVSCHQTDFNNTNNPSHVQAQFPTTCQNCHNTTSWGSATFDHSTTGWALTGFHLTMPCVQCHVNGNYTLTTANTVCVSCHQTDFNNTNNPSHVQAQFPTTCQNCHNTTSWGNATFDHSTTGWALTGFHLTMPCVQCHVNGNYTLTTANTVCVSCHQTDFNNTNNPSHVQAQFPTTCQNCHNTTSWGNATFDHSTTGWALTGFHLTMQCVQCHVNGNYTLTTANTVCVSCHQTDFNNTNNPSHVQAQFPTTCQNCHNTTAWGNATFDHSTTGFALTGFHLTLQCVQCHVNGNYNLTSANTACISCHQTDYNNTNNPPHASAGFPTTCQTCHTTTDWTGATFDHSTTGWALTGAHTTLQCTLCHVNNNYKLTSGACAQCHMTDYNGTTSPNHVQTGFPTTCDQCHTTTNWGNGTFDHSTTGWALTGFHLTMACSGCHVNGNYKLTSANTACVSCHQTDYNNTNNPNHAQVGFPTTCDTCHTTASWANASFNHNNTTFPLTGAHTTVACNLCHVNNNYTTLPTACYGCHQADYQGTTNPNHTSAGFPTTCQTCHTTTSWAGATFNHTYFPTNHGGANGVCPPCHTNPNDYSVFQCTNCHLKPQTDSNHQGINGYVYNSANCYQCHKNGGGG